VANRRITELPAINGLDINEQDLLTLVHVFEVDPTLRNKKITFVQLKDYLNQYYAKASIGAEKTIATATTPGTKGEICWDANYIYVCIATNTWKRTGLSSW
jgi:hypothetical protein